jgi:hypothetical protein
MKTNRTYQRGFAALALIFALAACTVDLTGPETGETIPPGMGLASIRLNGGSALTAVPDMSTYYFTLDFTAPDKTPVNKTLDGGVTTLIVPLEPATWNLEVNGYTDSGKGTLLVSGNITVPITAGTSASFNVSLSPDFSSAGTGTLDYAITFPVTVTRAVLGLYPIDNTPGTSQEVDITAAGTGTLATLPEGSYRAVIELFDETSSLAAARTEVVHIYDGLATPLTSPFTAADFAALPTVIEGTTLAAKLDAALASPSGSYTIVLDGTETDLAAFVPKTLNVTGSGKNISVTIRGGGETVQVDRPGTPLLTLAADTGSTLALTLQDLTLTGRSGNSVPVVQVNQRGTLAMKAGSRVTGNTSSSYGGGVYVDYGTFTMSGGEVSSNTSSYGGGVCVNYGTFTMSGGKVSGNTSSVVSSSSRGGGVYVGYGTFTMSGGEVSGNTSFSSSSYGGGVYVGSGTFTMSGGAVSGNTAFASGPLSSSSSYGGGGVYVGGGTFTMSGGEVRDNSLSGANSYGRDVVVNGTFKMSGNARPQRVFLATNTRFITISGPLSSGTVPIDLGITAAAPLAGWEYAQILRLDSSYSSGNLASLKTHFTPENAVLTESPYTEIPLLAGYTIGDDGRLPPLPSISGISYNASGGDPWTLEADGRYKSPATANSTTTKERVSFIAEAGAIIAVRLQVSSQSGDYAFISTLDNASAAYDNGYYPGSLISGSTSTTVFIPVPTADSHFIEICYRKDSSGVSGSDCVWFEILE